MRPIVFAGLMLIVLSFSVSSIDAQDARQSAVEKSSGVAAEPNEKVASEDVAKTPVAEMGEQGVGKKAIRGLLYEKSFPTSTPGVQEQQPGGDDRSEGRNDRSADDDKNLAANEKFDWKPALIQSGLFLGIKHGFRLFQKKTYSELDGPFFRDWGKSIKSLHGWNDGDSPFTNNFAHPFQGGITGRIFVNNSGRARRQEFGKSKEYWKSRFKALAWSTVWSTQFEFGPVSEATIGNVGLRHKNGHSTMAWTDLVMTPVVGTGLLIEEDMVDRFILRSWVERRANGRLTTKVKILRSILTPTMSFSNVLRGKVPWKRDTR